MTTNPANGQMHKILIIDDEAKIVDVIAEYLANRGFEVEKAYGGQEGLDKIDKVPSIDLIILDKKMPKVNGMAVMRHLKNFGIDIPVIVITGSISMSQLTHSRDTKYEHVFFKPVRLAILLETIKKVLASKRKKKE